MIHSVFDDNLKKFEEELGDFQAAGGQASQVTYDAVIQKLKEDDVAASVLSSFTLNQCLSAHGYQ
jgi:hypothetical protein